MTGAAQPPDDPGAFQAALADLHRAYETALAEVRAAPDDRGAYQRATELREAIKAIESVPAAERAAAAARIWQAEGLSIGQLAARLGISKTRAAQLLRAARDNGDL
jgi:DNA-directed RNA polymerase specialized sigma24 family protein